MISPITGKEMIVRKEWREMIFRKEVFHILFHSWYCVDSKELFEDDVFANFNYNQVVNQYREKHNIPFPEDIKAIREQYNLPARKMSMVLGLGENTYRLYETGEIPTLANAKLIQLAADPEYFIKLLAQCESLDIKHLEISKTRAESLIRKRENDDDSILSRFIGKRVRSRFTGYNLPDFQKFREMVLFFVSDQGVWKTKLNKLLFYADFAHYKYHNRSISGIEYCPINLGPVPHNFNTLFEILINEDVLDVYYQSFPDGGIGEKFWPKRHFDESLFNPYELDTLQKVREKLKDISTQEIIELSHQEQAWDENKTNKSQPIDYTYAYELNLL